MLRNQLWISSSSPLRTTLLLLQKQHPKHLHHQQQLCIRRCRLSTLFRCFLSTTTTTIVDSSCISSNNNSNQYYYYYSNYTNNEWRNKIALLLGTAATATTLAATTISTTFCDKNEEQNFVNNKSKKDEISSQGEESERRQQQQNESKVLFLSSSSITTPSNVAKENFLEVQESHDIDTMPIYTAEQVNANDGTDGKPIWMTYGGVVYDVTDFIANHPGGSEKILMAAGTAIEPYWFLYRQHYASDLPMRLMEHMAIGRLADADQEMINEQMSVLEETQDPYLKEPYRHKSLIVHSDTPMNAETPSHLLIQNYITPSSLFYIRHHHPVPYLTDQQIQNYQLYIDLSSIGGPSNYSISMNELKQMEKVEIIATLQCSGNRRSGYNTFQRTSGTSWGQGAISTSKFGGVRLRDLLIKAGMKDPIQAQNELGIEHVRFHALDGMSASIGIEKAMNPYGDVIVAYEMDGMPIPRDHGYPLRIIVPGYAAVRNVKWVHKIEVSKTEADGPWQRGLNYKTLPPSVVDAANIDLDTMPSMTEVSLFSGITNIEESSSGSSNNSSIGNDSSEDNPSSTGKGKLKPGDTTYVKVKGWAWAGGGRNIVRVDLTGDEGKTWATAKITEGSNQKFGRAWAWVFWECDPLPAIVHDDGTVRIASKAVDMAFNVQPENSDHTWNVRGLGNNSWYRAHARVL